MNDKRLPFTLPIIHLMVSQLRTGFFSSYANALLEVVFLLWGEFTARSKKFNSSQDLSLADFSLKSNHF